MKIYFSCAIVGGRADQPVYQELVECLQAWGHHVLTAELARPDVYEPEAVLPAAGVFQRDVNWLRECDRLVAEITTPSHGVGYEIAVAEQLGKPVLCLYQAGRRVSKMILGNPAVRCFGYHNLPQAKAELERFLAT